MRLLLVLLCAAAAVLAGCSSGENSVSELKGVEDLRDEFNRDAGQPRLILLLSPS
jgi:hypothetical protein